MGTRFRSILVNAAIVIVSTMIALSAIEGSYRYYLYASTSRLEEKRLAPAVNPRFDVFWPSLYSYADYGYDYTPGATVRFATIANGKIWDCQFTKISARGEHPAMASAHRWKPVPRWDGSFGPYVDTPYDEAALKIVVFGGSFSVHWPDMLQYRLEMMLEKPVRVIRLARDGFGLLQMIDQAKVKMKELKPDLAIIPFALSNLWQPRAWRIPYFRDGIHQTIISLKATTEPDYLTSSSNIGALMNPKVTDDWCRSVAERRSKPGFDGLDAEKEPLLTEFNEQHDTLRNLAAARPFAVDFLSTEVSFVYNRIVHGNVFYDMTLYAERTLYGPITISRYEDDPILVESVRAINALKIPYQLVVLPRFDLEGTAGKEYVFGRRGVPGEQEKSLLESLERVTGKKVLNLGRFLDPNRHDMSKLYNSPQNPHPTRLGYELYAEFLANVLVNELGVGKDD